MFTKREFIGRCREPILLISLVAATILATISGPFGTAELLGWASRFFFWLLILSSSFLLAIVTELIFRKENFNFGFWLLVFMGSGFFAVTATAMIYLQGWILFGSVSFSNSNVVEIFVTTTTMFVSVSFVKNILFPPPETPVQVLFLKRLRSDLGRDLLRISGQDHYVEVVTRTGSDLVLMRFSDALVELNGYSGMRVHRSHWVAKEAITGVYKTNGKMSLKLSDGKQLPVSRSYRNQLHKAGYLDDVPQLTEALEA